MNTAIKRVRDGQLAIIRQLHTKERAIKDMHPRAIFAAVTVTASVTVLQDAHRNYLSAESGRDCQYL